jgi:hypothetical protein
MSESPSEAELAFRSFVTACFLSGLASATHSGSGAQWHIPAAWRATVAGTSIIAHWQVYADNKPVYEILSRGA